MADKISGTILMVQDNKILVLSEGKYYILITDGHETGETIEFDPEKALPMPSYLFAVAAMAEENLDETLDFIQNKWFNND